MRVRTPILLLVALALALTPADAGARKSVSAHTLSVIKKHTRLQRFDSCAGLIAYARKYAPRVDQYYYANGAVAGTAGPPGPIPPSAPTTNDSSGGGPGAGGGETNGQPPAPATPTAGGGGALPDDTSGTNVQEQGVDEPDLVKTDGKTLFALENGYLNAVDARSATPKLLGSLKLDGWSQQMLLDSGRILLFAYSSFPLAVAQGGNAGGPVPTVAPLPYWYGATTISDVDVSDPANMKVVTTQTVEGDYINARLNGDTARVVISSHPRALYPTAPDSAAGQAAAWVPSSIVEKKATGATTQKRLTTCARVRRPRVFSGLDMLTVLTIDMKKGLPAVDSDALMTSADTVYASTDSLYVATQKWLPPAPEPDALPPKSTTAVHRFDISEPNETTYKSSGELPGYLLSQWSLSEYKGVLRAATTDSPQWWGGQQIAESQSYVSTLGETSGVLAPLGRVGGLGQGERIYAVRFIDDIGYVVTFRQVDPLYTVDLSNPAAPKVLGQLKIAGYSSYLHPVGKDLLLGIGQGASDAGLRQGTQLSLFDVSDPAHPARVQNTQLGNGASSTAEYDHHAFLYWPKTKLALVPLSIYTQPDFFSGAIGFRVDPKNGIDELGRIEHPKPEGWGYSPQIDRSVVVGNRVLTVSLAGAASNDLNSLGAAGFAAFPQPQYTYGDNTPAPGGPVEQGPNPPTSTPAQPPQPAKR